MSNHPAISPYPNGHPDAPHGTPDTFGMPPDDGTTKHLTFEEMAEIEPRLRDLLSEARSHRRTAGPDFCACATMDGKNENHPFPRHVPGLEARIKKLVGWHSGRSDYLGTYDAYRAVCCVIGAELPPCGPDCECRLLEDC